MGASKRQKITSTCWEVKDGLKTKSNIYIFDILPPEVMEMIFKFLPLQVVSTNVRLVSRQWLMIATSVLNGAFYLAGYRLNAIMNQIDLKLMLSKDTTELQVYSRAFYILELINAQYKMLRAVTWRYTHPPRPARFKRLCFYAGSLLDELNNLIHLAATRPAALHGPDGPDAEVKEFFGLCKHFMNYFEKVSERKLNRSVLVSGCKAVDVLDCLAEGRQVQAFRLTSGRGNRENVLCMQIRYVMRRTWFTCVKVPQVAGETSWRDEQRFMYMRLRRLVGSVNEHYYENVHYERELVIRSLLLPPKPITPSVYSAWGEYGDRFFYYGNANANAYASRFKKHIKPKNFGNNKNSTEIIPTFDVIIGIELRCSPEIAPLAVRSILKIDDFDNQIKSKNPELYYKMKVTCPASFANRLPGYFTWEQKAPRHYRNII